MRHISSLVVSLAVLLLGSRPVWALDPEQTAEAFMAKVRDGKASEAIVGLYASNPWVSKKPEVVENMRNQLTSSETLIGTLKSWEKLQDVWVGTRFRYMSYLAAYERQPIRYEFQFYRPDNDWLIFSFSFDSKLDESVESRARADIGKP